MLWLELDPDDADRLRVERRETIFRFMTELHKDDCAIRGVPKRRYGEPLPSMDIKPGELATYGADGDVIWTRERAKRVADYRGESPKFLGEPGSITKRKPRVNREQSLSLLLYAALSSTGIGSKHWRKFLIDSIDDVRKQNPDAYIAKRTIENYLSQVKKAGKSAEKQDWQGLADRLLGADD